MTTLQTPSPPISLEQESDVVLGRLRDCLASVITSTHGREIRKAVDIHKVFGLNRQLAWYVYRVATAPHPRDTGPFIPGTAQMNKFIQAAKRQGVNAEILNNVREAYAAFEAMVERHAGDRDTFESMISHSDEARRELIDLQRKREAFRANGHLWGVQSRAMVMTEILRPSTTPGKVDEATINGDVDSRQVRPEVALQDSIRWKHVDASSLEPAPEPIDPSGVVAGGVNLLADFCSKPTPEFNVQTDEEGYCRASLIRRGIGNCAATTYFIGNVIRGIPTNNDHSYIRRLHRPTELFLQDFLIHRSLWDGPPPQVSVCAVDLSNSNRPINWNGVKLPVQEKVVELGMGTDVLLTTEIPRYRDMIEHAFNCLGWPAKEFRVFRCKIEYPVMHSVIRLQFTKNA